MHHAPLLHPGYIPVGRVPEREITSRAPSPDSENFTSTIRSNDYSMKRMQHHAYCFSKHVHFYAYGKDVVKCFLQEGSTLWVTAAMTTDKSNRVNALAREGGLARARALTPEQRSEIARKAAQARWDRIVTPEGTVVHRVTSFLMQDVSDESRMLRQTEMDAMDEIWRKVQDHTKSTSCPCDDCVDSVITETRNRYVSILAKIDNEEKLDKDEALFFRLMIGSKPNRWTRVYRNECRRRNKVQA